MSKTGINIREGAIIKGYVTSPSPVGIELVGFYA
jgi:hypothetical protein